MNKNNEMLDKIQELRVLHPDSEIIFLVNSEECTDDYTYTKEEIASVTFDTIAKFKRKYDTLILCGDDEILEYISDQILETEYSNRDGDIESICSDEELESRSKYIFDSYIKDGTIQTSIIVQLHS
jgi:hypothetical protein